MAITPLNQGGTGADLSGTGGANQLVKQTGAGANFSVATLTTADVAGVSIVKNPTGAQTITGQGLTLTKTAPLTLAQFENVQIVDGTLSRGGTDIGDEINKAYAVLPATGGAIWIASQGSGAAYSFNTPIVFSTANKFVVLKGLAPSNTVGGFISGGVTLNFTPTAPTTPITLTLTSVATASGGVAVYGGTITGGGSNAFAGKTFRITGFSNSKNNGYFVCTASTATTLTLSNGLAVSPDTGGTATNLTTAITYANDTSGDGFNASQCIEGITIINNESTTANGGTGNATCGLDFSGGARLALKNVLISGFGVGAQYVSGANWGAAWYDTNVSQNNVGVLFFNGQENFNWFGGSLAVNDVGFSFSGVSIPAANSTFYGISIDSNVTFGIKETAGSLQTLTFVGCHWENFAGGSATTVPHYIYSETATVLIHGGTAIDDDGTTTDPAVDYWFSVGVGAGGALGNFFYLGVYGLLVQPAGRPATLIFRTGGRAFLQGEITNPGAVIAVCSSTLGPGFITNLFQNNAGFAENAMEISGALTLDSTLTAKGHVQVSGTQPTVSSSGLGSGSASVFSGTDSAFIVQLSPAGSPSASGAITVTFHSAFPNGAVVTATLLSNTGTWNARATAILTAQGTSGCTIGWNNNAVALTAGSAYFVMVHCIGF